MWFDSWSDVLRVLVVGGATYVFLIVALRFSGKRTLSQLNAFDLIVTVALGSTVATILLSSDVSWTEGAVVLLVLAGLQLLVAWLSVRLGFMRRAVTAEPAVVLRDGRFVEGMMTANRLTRSQVGQAVRAAGHGDLSAIAAVVLEPNGTLSVIAQDSLGSGSALPGGSG